MFETNIVPIYYVLSEGESSKFWVQSSIFKLQKLEGFATSATFTTNSKLNSILTAYSITEVYYYVTMLTMLKSLKHSP